MDDACKHAAVKLMMVLLSHFSLVMDTFTGQLVPGSEHLKCLFTLFLLGEVSVNDCIWCP